MLDALKPFTPPNKPVSIKSLHPTTRSSSRNGTKTPPLHQENTSDTTKHSSPDYTRTIAHRPSRRHHQSENQIMLTSLTNGHVWDRWKRHRIRHDREEAGSILLEKLRTIHLFEADYNWTLGLIFGRRMVHDAEQQDHLNESQWGSRGARQKKALIHKILLREITAHQTPLGTLDNDAKACYDRNHAIRITSARNMAFLCRHAS
jgi:hypothetical protein